jgi:hypothetical protein
MFKSHTDEQVFVDKFRVFLDKESFPKTGRASFFKKENIAHVYSRQRKFDKY